MTRRFFRLGWAIMLMLPLVAAPRPARAVEVTVALRAVGEAEPFVFSWIDDKDGKISVDPGVDDQIQALFAGAQYLVTDQNQVILAHGEGNEVAQVFAPAAAANNAEKTFFVVHLRSKDRTLFLDGTMERFNSDPKKGFAQWTLLLVNNDGSTISSVIQQNLTFPSATVSPTPPATDRTPTTRG
jgi:hypothetical protein